MEFHEWEPVYEAILDDFGYDRDGDEASAAWLTEHVDQFDVDRLDVGGAVAVAGAAPSLADETELAEDADAVFAASDAGVRLAERGVEPDLVVSDLDGDPAGTVELAAAGVPVAVHAHGDNREALRRYVPELPVERVLGTTQAAPVGPLVNYGGFTDGDRAAFLADALGADRLTFPGWDFEAAGTTKRRKLRWAARLLHWLERRRGERFGVLDGRRDDLDIDAFPEP